MASILAITYLDDYVQLVKKEEVQRREYGK
jgi:hypothetical protein